MEPFGEMMSNRGTYRDAHLTVDFQKQAASLDSQPLGLTRKEYELLAELVGNAGAIVPRAELLMRVWGYGEGIRTRTLDVHIRHLRRKLGVYAEQYIETIFGVGHRFQPYQAVRTFQPVFARPMQAIA
jgi:two-component system alkaline phosphatase synthesis response regulator PhoP